MNLLAAFSTFTEWTDHFLTRFRARRAWLRPLQFDAYRSYGTGNKFYITGRSQTAADSGWRNFRSMVRRFNSRTIRRQPLPRPGRS